MMMLRWVRERQGLRGGARLAGLCLLVTLGCETRERVLTPSARKLIELRKEEEDLTRSCNTTRKCIRDILSESFDVERDGLKLIEASACLTDFRGDLMKSLRCRFWEGLEERTGQPVGASEKYSDGCMPLGSGELSVYYSLVDEAECQCIGLPVYGQRCVPAALESLREVNKERGVSEGSLLRLSNHAGPFGAGGHNVRVSHPVAVEPKVHFPPERAGTELQFPLRSLLLARIARATGERMEIETRYRRVSGEELRKLFPPSEFDKLKGDMTKACRPRDFRDEKDSLELDWDLGKGPRSLQLPLNCAAAQEAFTRIEAKLLRLQPVSQCKATAAVPLGGAPCLAGVRDEPYVGVRFGLKQMRSVTPLLEDALCAGIGAILTAQGDE